MISDLQGVSGAGVGYSCVYQREKSGGVLEFGASFIDKGLMGYLSRRMYDPDASDPLSRYYSKDYIDANWASFSSYAVTDQIMHEKFSAENVLVVYKSFAEVRSLKGWQREVADHEFQLQLS